MYLRDSKRSLVLKKSSRKNINKNFELSLDLKKESEIEEEQDSEFISSN